MHFRLVGAELGLLGKDYAIDIDQVMALLLQKPVDLGQEPATVGAGPGRVGIGKVQADITQTRRPQHGVHEGVKEDVGIGVAQQPQGKGNVDPADNEIAAGDKLMNIKANAGPEMT